MNSKKKSKKFRCVECKSKFYIQKGCFRKRRLRVNEIICQKCYSKIGNTGRYHEEYYPKELRGMLDQEVWDYNVVKPFIDTLRTKRRVKFICQECNKEDIMSINSMHHRKICGCQPICKRCSLKFATSSKQWRESNSKAQYAAQNRPEVLEKQRKAQRRLMKIDPMYAEKRCSKSYISGKIKDMRFDSSWELFFIVYCWNAKNISKIERYGKSIVYFDKEGKERRYFPDFVVYYKNSKKKIIEIKGSRKYNNFHEKFNAARKKHGVNYVVYEENDLRDIGILVDNEKYLRDFYRGNHKNIIFFKNKKTETLKERIKQWLK